MLHISSGAARALKRYIIVATLNHNGIDLHFTMLHNGQFNLREKFVTPTWKINSN